MNSHNGNFLKKIPPAPIAFHENVQKIRDNQKLFEKIKKIKSHEIRKPYKKYFKQNPRESRDLIFFKSHELRKYFEM